MTMIPILLALAVTIIDLDIVSLPLNSDVRVALTPAGRVDMKREGTLTRVKVEIDRLQPPSTRGPALNTYVVWAISPEGIFENLGELDVDGNKGQLSATTPLGQLGILITAEPHYMVDRPNSEIAYRNQTARDQVRRITVPVEAGKYDYSALKALPPANLHGSVIQARAAFQIAQNENAEALAGVEFRNARVALGSMEEMVTRTAPLDILWPAAHEAIRWSQRAVSVAREKATLNALQSAKSETEALRVEKQRLDTHISQLTQDQATANEQIRILRSELAKAGSDKDQLTDQRDQAEARAQNAQRELAELEQKAQDLQGRLSLTLRNEFFDDKGLTEAGREALIRLFNIAEVVPGPIVLQGDAPEASIKAAMEFLLFAGIPQDRIITRR